MSLYKNYRVPTGTLTSTELADGSIAAVDIANDAITTNKLNSAGVAPIIVGGSINGQSIGSTRASAINALLPSQTGGSGRILKSDGTDVSFTTNDTVTFTIAQNVHGFAVGDAIYFNGTSYAKARSDVGTTLGTMIVSKVIDANDFEATLCGKITGLSGLTTGEYYFVSHVTAGTFMTTDVAPYSNPMLLATSATTGIVLPYRPSKATNEATILPSQSGQNGKYLKSDGSNSFWDPIDISTSDVSGVLTTAKGGTGVNGSTAANGTILIGNGSGYTLANLSVVTNDIAVTNGSGTIQLGLGSNAATLTGSQILTNKTLTNPIVTNYVETAYSANSSTYSTLSLTNGTIQLLTLDQASTTLTFPTAIAGKGFQLHIIQDGVGSRSLTWPNNTVLKWDSGTAPTITTTASKRDIFAFVSDGAYWYGSIFGQNF